MLTKEANNWRLPTLVLVILEIASRNHWLMWTTRAIARTAQIVGADPNRGMFPHAIIELHFILIILPTIFTQASLVHLFLELCALRSTLTPILSNLVYQSEALRDIPRLIILAAWIPCVFAWRWISISAKLLRIANAFINREPDVWQPFETRHVMHRLNACCSLIQVSPIIGRQVLVVTHAFIHELTLRITFMITSKILHSTMELNRENQSCYCAR